MVYSPKSDTRKASYETSHVLMDKLLRSLRYDVLARLLEHSSHTLVPVLMHRFKNEVAAVVGEYRALGHMPPEGHEYISRGAYNIVYGCCKRLAGYPTEHYDALVSALNTYKYLLLASRANEDVS